jgi:hypothetical protein
MVARRVALWLWVAWAIIVWNVVFDHVIVVAARQYLAAATLAAERGGPYARMDDWMRPAVGRGIRLASLFAGVILAVGAIGLRLATWADSEHREERTRTRP